MRQLMSVLIDAQRYDMKMLSVDILMFENHYCPLKMDGVKN